MDWGILIVRYRSESRRTITGKMRSHPTEKIMAMRLQLKAFSFTFMQPFPYLAPYGSSKSLPCILTNQSIEDPPMPVRTQVKAGPEMQIGPLGG